MRAKQSAKHDSTCDWGRGDILGAHIRAVASLHLSSCGSAIRLFVKESQGIMGVVARFKHRRENIVFQTESSYVDACNGLRHKLINHRVSQLIMLVPEQLLALFKQISSNLPN